MKKLQWLQWSYLFLLSACVISLSIIANLTLWGILGTCVLIIWFVMIQRSYEKQLKQRKRMPDAVRGRNDGASPDGRGDLAEQVIQTLNLYRHEWMNDVQLLVGYAKLKKFDKLQEYVENMKDKAIQEGFLFKIGDPTLALFLFASCVNQSNPLLKIEVEPELRLDQVAVEPKQTSELLINTVKMFQLIAKPTMDNKLLLKINTDQDSTLVVLFDYSGEYDQTRLIHTFHEWTKNRPANIQFTKPILEERRAAIQFRMPLAKTVDLGVTKCVCR